MSVNTRSDAFRKVNVDVYDEASLHQQIASGPSFLAHASSVLSHNRFSTKKNGNVTLVVQQTAPECQRACVGKRMAWVEHGGQSGVRGSTGRLGGSSEMKRSGRDTATAP